ncbi:YwqI/YxiC family protein [Aquibacillus rhizosphaerae]|uniref:YwqI/YxiC family protein n=1 Tax=Aquibacillus rhizosphaerae TaxID=3051431 RepID=A0ABT7L9W4_9BACI|nr:YwqI/YxiC family protein [Aquibacillus sp. LR5S19]MDL4842648.1 YwqI/YxiC family protein [Aquibacillus sp. LR5S19]
MANEIKINQLELENSLSNIKSTAESLEPSYPTNIGDGNQMDTVRKLNAVNHELERLVEAYKELFLQNEEMTRQSIKEMIDADVDLSNHISAK